MNGMDVEKLSFQMPDRTGFVVADVPINRFVRLVTNTWIRFPPEEKLCRQKYVRAVRDSRKEKKRERERLHSHYASYSIIDRAHYESGAVVMSLIDGET